MCHFKARSYDRAAFFLNKGKPYADKAGKKGVKAYTCSTHLLEFGKWIARCADGDSFQSQLIKGDASLYIFCLCFMLSSGRISAESDAAPHVINVLLKTAAEARDLNDYKTTIYLYEKILEMAPTNADALIQLGSGNIYTNYNVTNRLYIPE